MSMPRAAVSFLTSCSDSSKGWRGQRPTLNWRSEARARAYGSMSRLACAACGAEDQISLVVQPAITSAPTEVLAGLVERVTFHNDENGFAAGGNQIRTIGPGGKRGRFEGNTGIWAHGAWR